MVIVCVMSVPHISLTLAVMIVPSWGLVSVRPTRCGAGRPFSRITRRTRRGLVAVEHANSEVVGIHASRSANRFKIGARVIEHVARIRVQLPTSCPEGALFRAVALGLLL